MSDPMDELLEQQRLHTEKLLKSNFVSRNKKLLIIIISILMLLALGTGIYFVVMMPKVVEITSQ